MPIANVLDILIKGAGSHFDKNLVDTFLSISTDKIVKVFLYESNSKIAPKDAEVLKQYDLLSIYRMLSSETINEEQKTIIDLFNKYYLGKFEEKGDVQ